MRRHVWIAALLALLATQALAQTRPDRAGPPQRGGGTPPAEAIGLPPPPLPTAITHHVLDLPGRTLHFTATAGGIRLTDAQGQPQADIGVTAYLLDGADPATRPVTFVFNGGPGAGSVWLELGAVGPWRLDLGSVAPSEPPSLVPNAETWLDFTDLVFLDPPGTGFGRIVARGDAARERFWSVNGDLDALAEAIHRWLQQNNRMASPKILAGESYGGFRAPRLARMLPAGQGVAVSALVLISPALDIEMDLGNTVLSDAGRLPSLAAAERGATDRAALADVEAYARGEFVTDVLRGPRDKAAMDRLTAHVAALTGLDAGLVRRLDGRVSIRAYVQERRRDAHDITSAYDATVVAPDPFPDALRSDPPDPVLDGLRAPLGSAIADLGARVLDFHPEGTYQVLNLRVARAWDWGPGDTEAITALREDLGFDPRLRVVIAQGLSDLVVPYFTTQLLLDQMPAIGAPDRIKLLTVPGGHMFYAHDASRAALRDAAMGVIVGR